MASYAISPQATFTCPPCSIRRRRQGVEPPRRHTYCSTLSPKPKLICFSESSDDRALSDGVATTSLELDPKTRPVIHVDIYQSSGETLNGVPDHKLLAVHEDGMVSCFSRDLSAQEWSTHVTHRSPKGDPVLAVQVEHAAVLSVQQGKKSLLKNRDDILATLSGASGDPDGSLLVVIVRSGIQGDADGKSVLTLRVFTIRPAISQAHALSNQSKETLHELTSAILPEPNHFSSEKSTFTFHPAFGSLHQNFKANFAVYDLSESIPRLVHEIRLADETSSCLQLSPSLLACSRGSSLSIIDLPYWSLQAERDMTETFQALNSTQSPNKHRDPPINIRLLSYFALLDIVVVLDGRKVVAIQLSTNSSHSSGYRKRKRGGCLIDAIGHRSSLATGTTVQNVSERKLHSLGNHLPSSLTGQQWSDQKASLGRYSSQLDTRRFDDVAARVLGLESKKGDNSKLYSVNASAIDRRKLYHILGDIFAVDETQGSSRDLQTEEPKALKMRFLPRKICDWLIEECLLTTYHVEMALKHQGSLSFTAKVGTGALIAAIAALDTTLELVANILASNIPLSSGELVQILAIITRDTEGLETTEDTRLLTNGDSGGMDNTHDHEMQLTNGEATEPSHPNPSTPLDDTLRHRILTLTLKRLHACPSPSISRSLKHQLPPPQLRSLIDVLRLSIARNGWLSPYDDNTISPPDLQDNAQLTHIAHLFSSVIDSIGTAGWILGTSSSSMTDDHLNETAETISYMKAEISAALEGIEEATYLRGMLGEMLLCGKGTLQGGRKTVGRTNPASAGPIKPITIALDKGEEGRILPLGLHPAPVVSKTRIAAGGEIVERSARDIGRLKSKMVGRYSFERIIV